MISNHSMWSTRNNLQNPKANALIVNKVSLALRFVGWKILSTNFVIIRLEFFDKIKSWIFNSF